MQELQSRLDKNGYPVRQTHYFGPATTGYVKQFQTKNRLPATGVINAATWLKLMGGNAQETPTYTSSSQYYENRGRTARYRGILSFDDCPRSYSIFKSAVDAAAALKVTMVLAPTGQCPAGPAFNPAYARSKHQTTIGHSMTHPNLQQTLVKVSDAQLVTQIDPASKAPGYRRPPPGGFDAQVVRVMASQRHRRPGSRLHHPSIP